MITGFASKVHIYCGNHDKPIEMYVKQTDTDAFYACPRYYSENREEGELACPNRISINEYEKMINRLTEVIQDEEENNGEVYLKNYRFETNQAKYKVIKEEKDELGIQVINKRMTTIVHN